MATPKFSKKTIEFLGSWLSGGGEVEEKDLTDKIKKEVSQYKQEHDLTLYRGLKQEDKIEDDTIEFNFLSSWTYDLEMAKNFTEINIVISINVKKDNIFLDTTLIDPEFIISKFGGFPEEREVILNAGKYSIVEKIKL